MPRAALLEALTQCGNEQERLATLLRSGHPDTFGIQLGIADWIVEECIIRQELQHYVHR